MSDTVSMYRDLADTRRRLRDALGVNCPNCRIKEPKRTPTILVPGQRCKVDGYTDPRPEALIDRWYKEQCA